MISKQISSLNISKNAFDFVNFLNSSSNLSDDSFETPSIFFLIILIIFGSWS